MKSWILVIGMSLGAGVEAYRPPPARPQGRAIEGKRGSNRIPFEGFQRAMEQARNADADSPEKAVRELEGILASHPMATDIDYVHGWLVLLYARMDRVEETLRHYKALRARHSGLLTAGADGLHRTWEDHLLEARALLAKSAQADAKRAVEEIRRLDEPLARIQREEARALIKGLSEGRTPNAEILRRPRFHPVMVEMLIGGELKLSKSKAR